MPAASANKFPKLILEERLADGSDTANPAADHRALFLGEDGLLRLRDSAGGITSILAGVPAEDVTFDPTGLAIIASTDVQGALAELDAAVDAGGGASSLASGQVKRTAGDVTTTSTSPTDLTGASITFSTGAHRALLAFSGSWFCSAANTMAIDFDVDGTRIFGGNFPNAWNINHAGQAAPITIVAITGVLSAASHTFKVQWKTSGGTGTMQGTTDTPYLFSAAELLAA